MKSSIIILFMFLTTGLFSQSIYGKWKTIDDATGKPKSIVEIYDKNGKVYGRIIELINPSQENPLCTECTDDRKDQQITGMEIIREMVKDDDEYEDGTIVDPKTGEVYDCRLWVDSDEPDQLNVRGYVFLFYRTQTWERVK